jgi:hypothetical protein
MSDHKGARLILDALPPAKLLLADRGYDSNWFRDALARKGCKPCIPSAKSRKIPPLRPLRPHLLLKHLHRCIARLLPQSMSPEPRSLFETLVMPQKPDGLGILDESGCELFFGTKGKTMPRGPKGERRGALVTPAAQAAPHTS